MRNSSDFCSASSRKTRYLRFRTTLKEARGSGPLGVFRAVGLLNESDAIDRLSAQRVEAICRWFNIHLPVPKLEPAYWRAVFWFRSENGAMVKHLWELAEILCERGFPVEFVTTMDPGTICYADRLQVAAIPRSRSRLRRVH